MNFIDRSKLLACIIAVLLLSGCNIYNSIPAGYRTAVENADSGYLFTYFSDEGHGVRYAVSIDGLKWYALNQGEVIVPSGLGDVSLMRDPSIILGTDNKFHMTWTIGGVSFGIAHSDDLINWSGNTMLTPMQQFEGTVNCWAPEMFFNDKTDEYMIVWASTVTGAFPETAGSSEEEFNHRMYYMTTADFETYSETALFLDPGFNCIDMTIMKDGDHYLGFIKNETLFPFIAKNIRFAISDDPITGWDFSQKAITRSWVEGPSSLKIGDYYYLYYDHYIGSRYLGRRSKDLINWEMIAMDLKMPTGIRHGSPVEIGKDRLLELLDYFGEG